MAGSTSAAASAASTAVTSSHVGGGKKGSSASAGDSSSIGTSSADDLSLFSIVLSREQVCEGRRVVEALERLKLPDEASMGPRELASWHENKKTIVNSLQTLSSQIYSARARIVYELIQNADDCSFGGEEQQQQESGKEDGEANGKEDGETVSDGGEWRDSPDEAGGGARSKSRAAMREKRFLYIEASMMPSFRTTTSSASSPRPLRHVPGGRIEQARRALQDRPKGDYFKSVFQVTDRPLIVSPPFQFQFDTCSRGIFGYIVPSYTTSHTNCAGAPSPASPPPGLPHHLIRCNGGGGGGGAARRDACTDRHTPRLPVGGARAWNRAHARRASMGLRSPS